MPGTWHIFGPLDRLAQPPGELIAELTGEAIAWPIPVEHQPAEGASAIYLLRRVDGLGRTEISDRHVRVQRVDGALVVAPPFPIWPDRPSWRPRFRDAEWRLDFLWPASFDEMGVAELRLVREIAGETPEVFELHQPVGRERQWRLSVPAPVEHVRFRAEAVTAHGASSRSPWSAWLTPPPTVSTILQLL